MDLLTAILYCRVSTDEQADRGLSLDAQLEDCRRYAVRKGWVLGSEHADILTGQRDDRVGYQALLEEVRTLRASGQQVVVVVAALDRFGRRLLERIRSREELVKLGVAVHSVREGGELPELVANMLAVVAQEEVKTLGRRVKATRDYVRERGWHVPGRVAWGYQWRPATDEERAEGAPLSVFDIDHAAASYVRETFRMVADGMSARAATRWIATLPAEARAGLGLGIQAVLRVLRNDTYLARAPARWPPLIDEPTWLAVQDCIDGHQRLAHQATSRYLLTGFVRCPKCHGPVWGRYLQAEQDRYYRCGGCGNWSAHAASLERDVLAVVTEMVDHLGAVDLRQALREMARPDDLQSYRAARLAKFRRDAATLREKLTRAARLFVDGDLDRGGYELMRDEAQAELIAVEAEMTALGAMPRRKPLDVAYLQTLTRNAERVLVSGTMEHQRMLLAELVAGIEPTRIGRGRYRIATTWTVTGTALQDVLEASTLAANA